jgi:integrase
MAKRGRGEGSIGLRSDGRWHVRVPLPRDEQSGKRRYKHKYADTQAAAVELLKRASGQALAGELRTTSTPRVGAFLDKWHEQYSPDWKPATCSSYRLAIDTHIKPAFGHLRLEQLSPAKIQTWMRQQAEEHGARRRITLARATLRSALAEAVRLDLVSRNVAAARFKVPAPVKRPIMPFEFEQAVAFVAVAREHRLGALYLTSLACGMRIGEASGLKWADVDLDTGECRLRQQLQAVRVPRAKDAPAGKGKHRRVLVLQALKTEKSRRTLVLPAVSLDALKTHRTRQREERLKAGAKWRNEHDLVFTTSTGRPLDPRNVLRTVYALQEAAKIKPRRRFHDLRHSAASILLAQGVQLAEVSLLLGHSELRTTSDLYGHLAKQTAARAAGHMDAVLTPAAKG